MSCKLFIIISIFVISVLFCSYSVASTNFQNKVLDVYVVESISSTKILPDTFPLPGKKINFISISAARGEKKSASFVIRGLDDEIINFLPISSNFRSDNSVLSGDVLDIRVVKCWFQGGTAWDDIRSKPNAILTPELLLKDDSLIKINELEESNHIKVDLPSIGSVYKLISDRKKARLRNILTSIEDFPVEDSKKLLPLTVHKNSNKQYWITFHIPSDAQPGVYHGEISLVSNNKQVEIIKVNLEVYPFKLDNSKLEYGLYYRGVLVENGGSISSEHKSEEQFKAELVNMHDHGVDNPTVYQPFNNYEILKKVLAIRHEVGLSNKPLFYLGIRTEEPNNAFAVSRYKNQAVILFNIAKSYGINSCYIYGIDEAEADMLQRQRFVWKEIQKTGVGVFSAGWKQGSFELIGDVIDVFIDGQVPSKSISEKFHSTSKKIYSYNRPQVGVENPFIYRKNYGIRLWQLNYDGVMNYAYQDGFGDIWNDFDHDKFRDHCFTYPTANGVIDTIAWEGFREGVNDVRYISTLENKIDNLRTNNKLQTEIQDAKNFLDTLKDYSGSDFEDVRKKISYHIMKLE